MTIDETIGRALRAIDDATGEIRENSVWLSNTSTPWRELPQFSEAEAGRRAALGRDLLSRIDALEQNALPRELRLTLRVARYNAAVWSREDDWWWVVCDPLRIGFFGLFAPTAYTGGFLLNSIHKGLRAFPFASGGDLDRYAALLVDYSRLLDQFAERTRGQAERGIRMPKVQFERAVQLFSALRAAAPATLAVEASRIAEAARPGYPAEFERIVAALVIPAYDRLLAQLDEAYRRAAPAAIGMQQYPRGAEIYEELVRLHTTLPLTPADVHAAGVERMERLAARKLEIARSAGFADVAAFERHVESDPRWRARTPGELEAMFRRAADRIAPELAARFDVLPKAEAAAAALPAEVSGSMTFGYYEQPSPAHPRGTYYFNAPNLMQRALPNVAALTYHELMPGHHLHIGTQLENDGLPELRQRTLINAFNEGWAEYAATLAGEMGMYPTPEERYGRLTMEAFVTCRLVVDTGMNAAGWTLERARAYMREHSGMSETEIDSETVRYSCDIPAQSLAYKLGDDYFVDLREEMRARLGDRFDIRDFHAAALSPGSLPLPLVAENVRAAEPRSRGNG